MSMNGVITSEWTKLRSVRSTYVTMAAAAAGAIVIGMLVSHTDASSWPTMTAGQRSNVDPVTDSLVGLALGQLAFGALGALAITSEHGTGMIRTTLAAVPRRRRVLAAKIAVTGGLTLLVGEVLAFLSFFLGQWMLSGQHLDVSLGQHHALRAVSGAGLYLCVIALVGLGLGGIIRHTAGAVAAVIGAVFVIPRFIQALPDPWSHRVGNWTLNNAAVALVRTHPDRDVPSTGMALVVCLTWVVVTLGLAALLITRRDA